MHIHAIPFVACALVVLPFTLHGSAEFLTMDTLGYYTLMHVFMAAVTFVGLQWIVAPFGKHAVNSKALLTVDSYVSWAVQESPTLLSFVYFVTYEYPAKQMNFFDTPQVYFGSMATAVQQDVSCMLGRGTSAEMNENGSSSSCESLQVSIFAAHMYDGLTQFNLGVWLFLAHYLHRTIYYPWSLWRLRKSESKARPTDTKPASSSTPVPIQVPIAAFLYCLFNGRLQILANVRTQDACTTNNHGIVAYAAVLICYVLFFACMRINMNSDYYLMNLRVTKPYGEYKIPYGGLFDKVSCPNFFGEWVEWIAYGVAVAFATSLGGNVKCAEHSSTPSGSESDSTQRLFGVSIQVWAALSFSVYVLANLLPRAKAHHAWYLKRFGATYAHLNRKAMIPGVI